MIKGDNLRDRVRLLANFQRNIGKWVGVVAVNFFKDRFRMEAWIDKTVQKWPGRKSDSGISKKKRRAILVQSGALKRSIRITAVGDGYVRVGSDRKYAQIHNEGGTIRATAKVSEHKRRLYSFDVQLKDSGSTVRARKRDLMDSDAGVKRRFKGIKVLKKNTAYTTVKAHSRSINMTMKPRRYMGNSAFLNKRIATLIEYNLKKIFNK